MVKRQFVNTPPEVVTLIQGKLDSLSRSPKDAWYALRWICLYYAVFTYIFIEYVDAQPNRDPAEGRIVFAFFSVLGVFVAYFFFAGERSRVREPIRKLNEDLSSGKVELVTCSTQRVVLLTWDPPCLFADVDDGKVLFLTGEFVWIKPCMSGGRGPAQSVEYVPKPPRNSLPNTEFAFIQLSFSREILRIQCTGEYLEPAKILPRNNIKGILPENGSDFVASLDQIESAPWVEQRKKLANAKRYSAG